MKEKEYIRIGKAIGNSKIVGDFSLWQIAPPIAAFVLTIYLSTFINFFTACTISLWLLCSFFLLTGSRPDRYFRRLINRLRRYRRGFIPVKPLLKSEISNDRHPKPSPAKKWK